MNCKLNKLSLKSNKVIEEHEELKNSGARSQLGPFPSNEMTVVTGDKVIETFWWGAQPPNIVDKHY